MLGSCLSAERLSQRNAVPRVYGSDDEKHLRAGGSRKDQYRRDADLAFEFEDQPWFDGFRTLATNGIDKPVLNLFRMAGLMRGERLKTESTGAVTLAGGVRGNPDIDALAVRGDREISVLAWNYHDDDLPAPDAKVLLSITGFPTLTKRVLLRYHRIDQTHSNAWTAWQRMGSPQHPSAEQYAALEAAGQLQLFESPRWIGIGAGGDATLNVALPRQSVSLLQLTW